jgi:hypothetical protein
MMRIISRPCVGMVERFGLTLDWIYLGDISGLPHSLAIRIEEAADQRRGGRET